MIKKLTVATLNPDLDRSFTMKNLEELSRTYSERFCPVLINFDEYHPIGNVMYAGIDQLKGRLVVTVDIQDEADELIKGMVACVSYTCDIFKTDMGSGKYGQSGMTAMSVGIVMKADDNTIPPIV